jgi:hypothetical protein
MLGAATELFVDRLNALLVCIGFRREALSMEGAERGEWAPPRAPCSTFNS